MKNFTLPLALLIMVLIFLYAWNLRSKLESATSVLQEKDAQLTYFKANSGKTVSEKPGAEISRQDFEKHYSDLAADLKDLKVKIRSLNAVFKAAIEAKGEGVVTIVRDTVRLPGYIPFIMDSVFIDDSYLKLKAQIIPGTFESKLSYSYTYQDSIVMAIAGKRKWFLGNERLYGSARMSNPNARSLSQTAVLLKQRDKRFVISLGANYDPFSNRVSPGIHCGWALIKL
jgi:uncharacterized protein DUF6549